MKKKEVVEEVVADEGYRLEYVRLDTVARWPRNPKLHNDTGIVESIKRFGFTDPLVVDEGTGKLVSGHGRLEALGRMKKKGEPLPIRVKTDTDGEWMVPVMRGIAFQNENEAEAYLLAVNRLVEAGGWDDKMLGRIFADLQAQDLHRNLGWDDKAIAEIVRLSEQGDVTHEIKRDTNQKERLETYLAGEIKQVIFYFDAAEFETVMKRMSEIQTELGLKSNTEVFLHLLEVGDADANSDV